MAGAACKIIINQSTQAVTASLEQVLTIPWVREKISPAKADALLQELADLDIAHYLGTAAPVAPARGLAHLVWDLVDLGVFTDEVWRILAKPPAS